MKPRTPKLRYAQSRGSSNEWFTPEWLLKAARDALGGEIDLDPASCTEANEGVRAKTFWTASDDGLSKKWQADRLWLNPPYSSGTLRGWVGKLTKAVRNGDVGHALLLLNAATETRYGQEALAESNAVCFLKGRVRFEGPGKGTQGPPTGQMVMYYGPEPERFRKGFAGLGITFEGGKNHGVNEPIRGWVR